MCIRRLFKGAYGPGLALCALIGVFWAGSYRSIADIKLPVAAGSSRWQVLSYRGVISIALAENYPTTESAAFAIRHDDSEIADQWDERYYTGAIAGIGFEDAQIWLRSPDDDPVVRHWTALNLPYWLLMFVAMLAPLHGLFICIRAHRRVTHNQCGVCGYDLGDGEHCQACAARAMLMGASPRMHLVR